jgi:MFS family permease
VIHRIDEQGLDLRDIARRYLSALEVRDFRWLWMGSMSEHSAYWALIVARGILILSITGSSLMVGVTTFAAMAPRFLVPPIAGFLADRFDRQQIVRISFALNLVNTGILTALAYSGWIQPWHVVALSVVNGTLRTFETTSIATLVPNMVSRDNLMNAVALNQVTLQGSRLIGPGLMAPALLYYGPEASFLFSTVLYVFGLFAVSRIGTRSHGGLGRGSSFGSSIMEAVRFVYRDPRLLGIFVITALHCSITMSYESLLPIFSADVMGAGAGGVTYLMMGIGAGGMVSVILIAGIRGDRTRGMVLFLTGVMSGVSIYALSMSTSIGMAIPSAFVMGASQAGFMAIVNALIHYISPDEIRGRVAGLNQINIGGTMALVNLGNGFFADLTGPVLVLMVLGTAYPIMVVLSLGFRTMRNIYAGTTGLSPR